MYTVASFCRHPGLIEEVSFTCERNVSASSLCCAAPVVDTGIRLRINALATKSALWDVGRRCNLYKECFRLKGRPRPISESTIGGSVSCVCVCVGGGGGRGGHMLVVLKSQNLR